MKKLSAFLFTTCLLIFSACNTGTNQEDSVDSAKEVNEQNDTSGGMMGSDTTAMSSAPVDKDASEFVVEAAAGGMMEVEMGKMAQEKATNQRVKDFGAMMVRDHTQANDKLKALAAQKNIAIPGSLGMDAQKDMDNLGKKTGNEFDRAYMRKMLDDHNKDVKKFQNAASDLKDTDIKNFAAQTLPTLQMHLDSAKVISGKF